MALAAAKKYAERCIALGGSWVRFNQMTDRTEYLELEVSVLEEHEKLWRLTERQSSSGTNPKGMQGMQEDNPTEDVVQQGEASPAKASPAKAKNAPSKMDAKN